MEFGEARHLHDLRDMNTCIDWFNSHDPFDGNVPQVRSVSSGLAASEGDGVKCDETEKVVSEIQGSFENVYVRNATIKERRRMVHTLSELKPGLRWIRESSCRSTITSCSCVAQL